MMVSLPCHPVCRALSSAFQAGCHLWVKGWADLSSASLEPLLGWFCLNSHHCLIHLPLASSWVLRTILFSCSPQKWCSKGPTRAQVHGWFWGWGTKKALGSFPVSVQGIVLGMSVLSITGLLFNSDSAWL